MAKHQISGNSDGTASVETPACVIGDRHVGQAVATRLAASGAAVTFVGASPIADPPPDVTTKEVDELDSDAVVAVDADEANVVVVVGTADSTNLLLTQLVRVEYEPETIVVLVNDPGRVRAFEDLGVETIVLPDVLAAVVTEQL
jgi:Trk K+ transport system NAD-binding subunit